MFNLQKEIFDSLPQLEVLFERYELDVKPLQEIKAETQSFKMRVPLVGAFSAGKSSLLNAILGQKLLSVEIDPASSLATELHYDPVEQIIGHAKDGKTITLSREDLYSQNFAGLVPDGSVEVRLNSEVLARYPHVCLADLPGLDSKNVQHEAAINQYIGRSLAYCLVVSCDEGTLHETTKNFLTELALHQAPVLVVISKSDKKTESDLASIVVQLDKQVRDILGENAKFDVVTASRKNTEDFLQALGRLESKSEQRYRETVGAKAGQLVDGLVKKLGILSNLDNLDHEALTVKRQQVESEMQSYRDNLQLETTEVESQLAGVQEKIGTLVESRLTSQLEQLASQVANQSDISSTVSQTVRLAITEGIQQEFAPLVQRYIKRVEDELPHSLDVPNHFNFEQRESHDFNLWFGSAATVVSLVLKRFPVVAVLMPIITSLIETFFSQKNREQQREEQREQARGYVLATVIPQVMQQVRLNLRSHLNAQLQQVKQSLSEDAQTRATAYQATLNELDEQLQHGAAAFAKVCEGYSQDQAAIQVMINSWKQA